MQATKSDTNKITWEDTEVPAVCTQCLGANPYIRMTKEKYGAECKMCTRPFTVFRWQPERAQKGSSRGKPLKTNVCLTCSRQKNCCQSCSLDLTYGLPLAIRDAALKMEQEGGGGGLSLSSSSNTITKQFIAQNYEEQLKQDQRLLTDNSVTGTGKAQSAAKGLLKQLANAMPYRKELYEKGQKDKRPADSRDSKALTADVTKIASKLPLTGSTTPVPKDASIKSLFFMGVEDDLPEHVIRKHFTETGGTISLLTVVHRAHCGYVVFETRAAAEKAAASISGGRLVLNGCRLRVAWGKPRNLGASSDEQWKLGQMIKKYLRSKSGGSSKDGAAGRDEAAPPPPPGQGIKYQSQGNIEL
ncbi:Pre-mRNA-splicing factor SLT11 [Yarrowia sp. C11]|nr:Pre-mRNA-splicing factor SLT11 [Yarrowia sp. C11]KAG5371206.1 Pre-mRNA-splicing factor SLT11 [Yarrowia sp. E02]